MSELVRRLHAQAFGTERSAIRIPFIDGMGMLIERNGSHALSKAVQW